MDGPPKTATISSAVVPGIAEHHITAVSGSKELVEQNETVCLLFTTTSCMYNNQSCERTNFIWRARWSPYTLDYWAASWITWLNLLKNDNFSRKSDKIGQSQQYPKGQLISKCLFGVFNFFQKMNQNMSHSSKNKFIHLILEEFSAW